MRFIYFTPSPFPNRAMRNLTLWLHAWQTSTHLTDFHSDKIQWGNERMQWRIVSLIKIVLYSWSTRQINPISIKFHQGFFKRVHKNFIWQFIPWNLYTCVKLGKQSLEWTTVVQIEICFQAFLLRELYQCQIQKKEIPVCTSELFDRWQFYIPVIQLKLHLNLQTCISVRTDEKFQKTC